jgi:hypothetical protein
MAVFSDGGWRTAVRGKWDGGGPVKHHTGGRERESGRGRAGGAPAHRTSSMAVPTREKGH